MVFCDNCGHELRSTAKFCGSCGTPREPTDDTPKPSRGRLARFRKKSRAEELAEYEEEETTSQDTNPTYTDSQVSDSTPPPKQKRSMGKAKKFGIGLVILIVVFVVFGAVASSVSSGPTFTTPQLSEQEIKDASIGCIKRACASGSGVNFSYNDLLRNNDAYVGKIIDFHGKVRAVYNDNLLLDVNYSKPDYDWLLIRINYDDDSCLVLSDDPITVWGTVAGLDTYSSALGNRNTVPEVNALVMEIIIGNAYRNCL